MKPPPFGYARPASVEEATSLLADLGSDAKVLAGGQSLVPLLNFRLVRPTYLVDVNDLPELATLVCAEGLSVGALARHRMVEVAPPLQASPWTAFGEGMRLVGHLPIRVRGTVGGSLAHADPSAELPLLMVTFGGAVVAQSSSTTREIPIDEFFTGFLTTSLDPAELVTGIRVSAPPHGAASAFEEFAERAGDFAMVAVCCALAAEGEECSWARIGVGGAEPVPRRITEAEDCLVGRPLSGPAIAEAAAIVARELDPVSDNRADAVFRRELANVLARRALGRISPNNADDLRAAP